MSKIIEKTTVQKVISFSMFTKHGEYMTDKLVAKKKMSENESRK